MQRHLGGDAATPSGNEDYGLRVEYWCLGLRAGAGCVDQPERCTKSGTIADFHQSVRRLQLAKQAGRHLDSGCRVQVDRLHSQGRLLAAKRFQHAHDPTVSRECLVRQSPHSERAAESGGCQNRPTLIAITTEVQQRRLNPVKQAAHVLGPAPLPAIDVEPDIGATRSQRAQMDERFDATEVGTHRSYALGDALPHGGGGGNNNGMSALLEHAPDLFPDTRFVVHDHHRAGAAQRTEAVNRRRRNSFQRVAASRGCDHYTFIKRARDSASQQVEHAA